MAAEVMSILFVSLVALSILCAVSLTKDRTRIALVVLVGAAGAAGWIGIRAAATDAGVLRHRSSKHCAYVASDLERVAVGFEPATAGGVPPSAEVIRIARIGLDADFVGHHIGELGFCVGWEHQASCEPRLWSAVADAAEPAAIAHDLRVVATALAAGAPCPNE